MIIFVPPIFVVGIFSRLVQRMRKRRICVVVLCARVSAGKRETLRVDGRLDAVGGNHSWLSPQFLDDASRC